MTTFVADLRLTGGDAPVLLDGPINAEIFLAYVERVLVPTLRPGDVVIIPFADAPHRLSGEGTILGATKARPFATRSKGPAPNAVFRRPLPRI